MKDFLLCNLEVMLWSHDRCYFYPENNFLICNYDCALKSRLSTLRILSSLRPMRSSYYSAWWVPCKPPHLSPTVDAGHQFCESPGRPCQCADPALKHLPQSITLSSLCPALSVQVASFILPHLSSSHRTRCTMFPSHIDLGASGWPCVVPHWPWFLFSWEFLVIQLK